ncbi:hypothetical protein VP01_5384g1 [Puccinia sorghi]|uniref:Uncharacterized protein n=1 Tax=Puccinia sorghi TaxID=27349 RepID=A0A0L6ULZ6_9BASI|nr:hypothetical protein VP01_5384g1 [Puccinia sorghi]
MSSAAATAETCSHPLAYISSTTMAELSILKIEFIIEKETNNLNSVNEEDLEDSLSHLDDNDDSSYNDEDVADLLIPAAEAPVGRVLRERTLQVKPAKYSQFNEDPQTFCHAFSCDKSSDWKMAIDSKLNNIQDHNTWTLMRWFEEINYCHSISDALWKEKLTLWFHCGELLEC